MKVDTKKYQKLWDQQKMRRPRLEKVVINFALGRSGPDLERVRTLAENLTGHNPADSRAKDAVRGFNIRKGEPNGCHVTLRHEEAKEFLTKAFYAIDDKILQRNFDNRGNVAITVPDILNLPIIKFDRMIGVWGFPVTANLERLGYRIKRRRLKQKKIPTKHQITKEETMAWFQTEFDQLKILEKAEE